MLVEEIPPRAAQEQEGRLDRLHQVLREVEQCPLGPVDVVEHHDHRALGGERLDESTDAPGDLFGREGILGETDRGGDALARVGDVGEERQHALGSATSAGSSCDDLRQPADGLGDRPVGDALAVGEASTGQRRELAPASIEEPVQEPRLPRPRRRRTTVTSCGRPVSRTRSRHLRQFQAAARPARPAGDRCDGRAASPAPGMQELVGGNAFRLALELERLDRFDLDGVAHQLVRRAHRSGLRRSGAACSSRAAMLTVSPVTSRWPRGDVAGDDLAGVDAGAVLQTDALVRSGAVR